MAGTGLSGAVPPRLGAEVELEITKVTVGGHGLADLDGRRVLVPSAVPGERILVRLARIWDSHIEATPLRTLRAAPDQLRPRCKHFEECGGCLWQHLPYDRQLGLKEEIVRDALAEIIPVPEKVREQLPGRVLPVIPSPQIYYYRNKVELTFGFVTPPGGRQAPPASFSRTIPLESGVGLGYHRPGTWSTILPIDECHLYDERIPTILLEAREFLRHSRLPVYNPKTHRGVLRTLLLRRGVQTGEEMVCFLVAARKKDLEPMFQTFLRFGSRPAVTSLLIVEHFGLSDKPQKVPRVHILKGNPTIRERLFDLSFDLSPFSFFQTNTLGAEKLYATIASALSLTGRETLLDCYCGLGSIGQYLSRFCNHVVGVESHPSAIEDALQSAGKNRIANISFYHGRAEEVLVRKLPPKGKYAFSAVVLDPPRAGLHASVIQAVLDHQPAKIAYVSCNPATLARDLGGFLTKGYEVRLVQPVDLFPQTAHVETVTLLQRK